MYVIYLYLFLMKLKFNNNNDGFCVSQQNMMITFTTGGWEAFLNKMTEIWQEIDIIISLKQKKIEDDDDGFIYLVKSCLKNSLCW